MFDKNSFIVKVWVTNIKEKGFLKEDVPNISNLRKVVYEMLEN